MQPSLVNLISNDDHLVFYLFQTYGDSSTWSSDDVYNLGIIAQGLTSTELSALTQLTIDSMYSIGRHDGWSETQVLFFYFDLCMITNNCHCKYRDHTCTCYFQALILVMSPRLYKTCFHAHVTDLQP